MCIARREKKVADSHEIPVRHDRLHEAARHAFPAVLREHEHIAEPRERCPIAHDAREPDLRAVLPRERAEAQRALEAAIENVPWQSRRPVRILVEETKDDVAIDRV